MYALQKGRLLKYWVHDGIDILFMDKLMDYKLYQNDWYWYVIFYEKY